ncbi:MAG: hypothetical protein ACPGVG_12140 [Mycobacterium sp.]
MSNIDVYPVGVLEAWQHRRIPGRLRREGRHLTYQLRRRNWRAIHNSFNGYLAEPDSWVFATRCGTGWTKRRALNDLRRHMRNGGGR